MSVSRTIKNVVKKLPRIRDIVAERDKLRKDCGIVPPGHFYSPIPSIEELKADESSIFGVAPRDIPGINLHEQDQLELLKKFADYYKDMPFTVNKKEGLRYYFENPAYSYSDAIFSHCMIRHLKPQRIIEVGSGFSSCLTLDTNDRFFNGQISTKFIEPYPKLLRELVHEEDLKNLEIIPSRLQDVEIDAFKELEENDILFIDSTHVSKINSDVNRIFFNILPALNSGVHIHFHDVFYPFEYPKSWIYEGRAWNEIYMLRTFLQYNSLFSIVCMNTFLEQFHEDFFQEQMPLCLENTGGSIWIRKD